MHTSDVPTTQSVGQPITSSLTKALIGVDARWRPKTNNLFLTLLLTASLNMEVVWDCSVTRLGDF